MTPTEAVLWDLLLDLDGVAAGVWDDGSPFHAGIKEGIERAAVLVRGHLAHVVESGSR